MRYLVGIIYDWLRIIDDEVDVDDIISYLRFTDYDGDDIHSRRVLGHSFYGETSLDTSHCK